MSILLRPWAATDYLGPEQNHLLLANIQLLIGLFQLVEQQLVALLKLIGCAAVGGLVADVLPQLVQVVLQLLVLRFKLLPLEMVKGN